MSEGRNLFDKIREETEEKKTRIRNEYQKKMEPTLREIAQLEKKLEPLKKDRDRQLKTLEEGKIKRFGEELAVICGESFETFMKFVEKVRKRDLTKYKGDYDKDQVKWIKEASLPDYLLDTCEMFEDWDVFLEENVKDLSPEEQKEILLILWKLKHA